MSNKCAFCQSNSEDNKNLSFHLFPKNEEIRRQWIANMGCAEWIPANTSKLCSRHFDPRCFYTLDSRKVLNRYSVPKIFDAAEMERFRKSTEELMIIRMCYKGESRMFRVSEEDAKPSKTDVHTKPYPKTSKVTGCSYRLDPEGPEAVMKWLKSATTHDHTYASSDEPHVKKAKDANKAKIDAMRQINRVMKQKAKRAKLKMEAMKGVIKSLKKKKKKRVKKK